MVSFEDIVNAYFSCRKNKRNSPAPVEFELHWQRYCLDLMNDINQRTLQLSAYSFVVTVPRPREVFASDMKGRVLHHYIDMRIRPLLENRLSEHTYNNRIGKGTQACQNAVIEAVYDASEGYTKDAYIIKVDIKGCFPNINQDIAYEQLRSLIESDYHGSDKNDLLYILSRCIYSYPTRHLSRSRKLKDWSIIPDEKSLFRKSDGTGAAIGFLVWQNAVNYYFNDIDKWLDSLGIRFARYVDDYYIITDNKESTLAILPQMRERLAKLGAELHPRKFYCQHWNKGFECLGVHVKGWNVHPNRRIIERARRKAREFNRCVSAERIDSLLSQLNSYFGICANTCGFKAAQSIVAELAPGWFRYIIFDTDRRCLRALPKYTKRKLIVKQNDKRRN